MTMNFNIAILKHNCLITVSLNITTINHSKFSILHGCIDSKIISIFKFIIVLSSLNPRDMFCNNYWDIRLATYHPFYFAISRTLFVPSSKEAS